MGVWVALEKGWGSTAPQLVHDIWPTFAPGHYSTHNPLPSLSRPLRLIKLDQDDTNNWLKLQPVCRPNDPYLTPFVAMVSLFPRRAPFGTVYLGSVTSVLAQSPAERNSPLTSWEWQKGYISRRCLGNYQRAYMVTPFHPFCSKSPEDTCRGSGWGGFVWNVLVWYQYPTFGGKNRLGTPGDDLFWGSECKERDRNL